MIVSSSLVQESADCAITYPTSKYMPTLHQWPHPLHKVALDNVIAVAASFSSCDLIKALSLKYYDI